MIWGKGKGSIRIEGEKGSWEGKEGHGKARYTKEMENRVKQDRDDGTALP